MDWQRLKVSDIADVNPKKDFGNLKPSTEVSFVPMDSVDGATGTIAKKQTRTLGAVMKGYTFFHNGDVIFAKITPCMENGKCAVASRLTNGIGFGSTEFYVVRPKVDVLPEYIWYFLRQERVRNEAKTQFTGAAGQKRVPKEFVENLEISIPYKNGKPDPIEQKRIIDKLGNVFSQAQIGEEKVLKTTSKIRMLFISYLRNRFDDPELEKVEFGKVCHISGGFGFPHSYQEHKNEKYPFYKVSDMNTEGNEIYMTKHNHSISEDDAKKLKVKIYPAGTIIFPKIGGAIATNKKRILSVPSTVDNNVMVLVPKEGVHSEYLYNYLLDFDLTTWSNKSALPSIRKSDVEKTKVPIPMKNGKPDSLAQERFAQKVKAVQEKIIMLLQFSEHNQQALNQLKLSSSDYAFKPKAQAVSLPVINATQTIAAPRMFDIQQAVAHILKRIERGEMVVAKMLYLAQAIYQVPLNIQFSAQNFGPYDTAVKKAVMAGLSSRNKFFTKKGSGSMQVLALGANSNNILKYSTSGIARKTNAYLDAVMPYFSVSDSASIERLATICKIIEDEKTADESIVKAKLQNWKPNKFQDIDIARTIAFIKKHNWDRQLIT